MAGLHARAFVRQLVRRPAEILSAGLAVMLGIGLNTAVVASISQVVWPGLPYPDPEALVTVLATLPDNQQPGRYVLTGSEATAFRLRTSVFASVGSIKRWPATRDALLDYSGGDGGTRRVSGAFVTPNLFEVVGVQAALGRLFRSDDVGGPVPVAVLSHEFWRGKLAGRSNVLGQIVRLSGVPHLIIGILPEAFVPPLPGSISTTLVASEIDVWLLQKPAEVAGQESLGLSFELIARLKPHVSISEATAHISDVAATIPLPPHATSRMRYVVQSLGNALFVNARPSALGLGAVAVCVFLVACLNVAILTLVWAHDRRTEIAIQIACGAGLRHVLRDGILTAAYVAIPAVMVGVWSGSATRAVLGQWVPGRFFSETTDPTVIGLVTLAGVSCVVACGLLVVGTVGAIADAVRRAPAILKDSGLTATAGVSLRRAQRVFVGSQIVLVMVLLAVGAGVWVGAQRLYAADQRADDEATLVLQLWRLERRDTENSSLIRFQDEIRNRLSAVAGVEAVGIGSEQPFIRTRKGSYVVRIPSGVQEGRPRTLFVRGDHVDREFFGIRRIGLVHGRLFDASDDRDASPRAIVSESFARVAFGNADAVGRIIEWHGRREVIGVVRDADFGKDGRSDEPTIYIPRHQEAVMRMYLYLKTSAPHAVTAADVYSAVSRTDPEQPIDWMMTLSDLKKDAVADVEMLGKATTLLGAIGLVLSLVGLHGMISYSIRTRFRELAIRLTCGATPALVRRGLVGEVLLQMSGAALVALPLCFIAWRVGQTYLAWLGGGVMVGASALLSAAFVIVLCCVMAYYASRGIDDRRLMKAIREVNGP